jgi:lipopolysaccharide/colanic/teichoic acid biosynthesis glycosyltransferase
MGNGTKNGGNSARSAYGVPPKTWRRNQTRRATGIPRWKRALDLILILISLPLWLPLMMLIMLLVKVTSPGPVFYRQERVGFRRRRFYIWKFRSMQVSAETRTHQQHLLHLIEAGGPMKKLDSSGDPRLLPWGRTLRATGLDELPQIFNVIRGDMSLVGPRPCLPYEFERYDPGQRARVNAPPGLTGYWQVNGKNNTTFNEMVAMDIFYSNHMSIWLDLQIILKTVPAIMSQLLESRAASHPDRPAGQGTTLLETFKSSPRKT